MASRIRLLLNKLFATPEYRILLIGLDASGKTSILYKLKLGETVCTIPTIGFNVETITYKSTAWTLWDVGGCDKIRPLIRHYFQNTQALIVVIDSNDKERLPQARDELSRILSADELRNAPILIYLNKIDLPNRMSPHYIMDAMELSTIRNRAWHTQPCCATTGDGLYEGFDWLVKALKSTHTTSSTHELAESIVTATSVANAAHDDTKEVEWLSQIDDDTNEEFMENFEKHLLTTDAFDHRTLLRAIWAGLTLYGRKQAIKVLFDHLQVYLKDMNETQVYFWIQIVHYAFETTKNPSHDFTGFLLMNPQLLNENELPLSYYKKETLFSSQAKTNVILPDVKPLPSILPALTASKKNLEEKKTASSVELTPDELDDGEFLKQFETFALQSWSHKTHIRMAWLYLTRDGRRTGVNKIFDGIKNFIQNSPIARKTTFHFTMTYFWIQMIDLAIIQSPTGVTFEEFLRLNPQLLNGGLFLEYYKKETMLNNPTAREQMVLPDVKPLPTMIPSGKKK